MRGEVFFKGQKGCLQAGLQQMRGKLFAGTRAEVAGAGKGKEKG